MILLKHCLRGLLTVAPLCGVATALANDITGPSSSAAPYLLRTQPSVVTVSILTAGDAVNYKADGVTPYRMVGIPDGLGAFDNGNGTFTLLANHEIPLNTNGVPFGIVRDHGFAGAFVSKWTIDKSTLTVLHGEDLIKHAFTWDLSSYSYQPITNAFARFCSADLPPLSAFYNAATGKGYNGRIYMNGEEQATVGRAFAHLLDGNSFELPWLGKLAWENSVAHPNTGDKTVVCGMDDGPGGQVYVYVGEKTTSAHPIAAAGLANGVLYGIKVSGVTAENPAVGIPSGTAFTGFNLGDVSGLTGDQLETNSFDNGVTTFQRPEDGCWDPSNPNDFYFVTTANFTGRSRLWRLCFINPADPALGGTIDMLLDGTEGPKMMDNITISRRGSIFIQEDVGNQNHLGKIWRYSIKKDTVELVAQHDPNLFDPLSPNFLTRDEESSGIIPADDILGEGWYLLDVQAHFLSADPEIFEGGQINALHFPPGREK